MAFAANCYAKSVLRCFAFQSNYGGGQKNAAREKRDFFKSLKVW